VWSVWGSREEVEEWARKNKWEALNYEVKIYPKALVVTSAA
jgi:hypothetical protein